MKRSSAVHLLERFERIPSVTCLQYCQKPIGLPGNSDSKSRKSVVKKNLESKSIIVEYTFK